MEEKLIYREKGNLRLSYIDSFHPSQTNIKADNWYPHFELSLVKESFKFAENFTGNYWILNDADDLIVFEVYANDYFSKESIKTENDIQLQLLLIDFKQKAFSKFSALQNGYFNNLYLEGNSTLVYEKVRTGQVGVMEVDIRTLKYNPYN